MQGSFKFQGFPHQFQSNPQQMQFNSNTQDNYNSRDQFKNSFRGIGREINFDNYFDPQCQLCEKIGHLVAKCWFHFN